MRAAEKEGHAFGNGQRRKQWVVAWVLLIVQEQRPRPAVQPAKPVYISYGQDHAAPVPYVRLLSLTIVRGHQSYVSYPYIISRGVAVAAIVIFTW